MATAHGGLIHVGIQQGHAVQPSEERAWFPLVCGHCGDRGTAAVIAFTFDGNQVPQERWVRCPGCGHGSVVLYDTQQHPGPVPGRSVSGLPNEVEDAYSEARRCLQVNAFTACEMVCRKILMHVAVDKGAPQSKTSFAAFVEHLETAGYVTPPMKPWVDFIRKRGNIAVHELPHTTSEQATGTLTFTEQLLRNVYEMAMLSERFAGVPDDQSADDAGSAAT